MRKISLNPTLLYYKDVAKYQTSMTIEEEENLFDHYTHCREAFEREIFNNDLAIVKFTAMYAKVLLENKSVAKLSNKFNNTEAGHNKKVAIKLNDQLPEALIRADPSELQKLGIARFVYEELFSYLKKEGEDVMLAQVLWDAMAELTDKLVCTALMAAQEIAHKYHAFGISLDDLIQEANIGMHSSVATYNPAYRTSSGNRIKWITYAYRKAEARVKEWIMEQSREIRLPFSKLELIFILIEASRNIQKNKDQSDQALTIEVNKLLKNKGKSPMSIEDVHEVLILFHGNTIHMDKVATGFSDDAQKPRTLGELLEEPGRNAEEQYLYKEDEGRLITILNNKLNRSEFYVISIRYLEFDKTVSSREVGEIMYERGLTKADKPITRQRIDQLENSAMQKLKDDPILKGLLVNNTFSIREKK